jgi:pimeloyl-ACP methyl ester carboxylesterase
MSLHVESSGPQDAPAIVFLHGAGISSWMWTSQVAALNEKYRCITVDLPGNGESHQTLWRSMAETADQVAEVIRACTATGKAHVVGLSLGGYVATYVLDRHPNRVESVLVSGMTARPFENQRRWKLVLGIISRLVNFKPYIWLNTKMMQLPPDAAVAMARDMRRMSGETLRTIYAELLPFALPRSLGTLDQRMLAVAGDKEAAAIRNDLAEFPKLMRNAKAAVVPEAHHAWNGEHPELFTAMIDAWVSEAALPEELRTIVPT